MFINPAFGIGYRFGVRVQSRTFCTVASTYRTDAKQINNVRKRPFSSHRLPLLPSRWTHASRLVEVESQSLRNWRASRVNSSPPEVCRSAWLGEATDGDLKAMLGPLDAELRTAWEVSPRINSPRHNGPERVECYSGGQAPTSAVDVPDSA